jgi:IPT/TIG domain
MSDFSKLPQEVLADNVAKGYVGVHIEQGVPILDRDLNLLHDLITQAVRSIVTRYIGNGLPTGGQGFAVQAIPSANDFRILAGAPPPGACLVAGIEVTIAADTTYGAQPNLPALTTPTAAQPDPREDTVYLDVSLETVDGTSDADLLNPGDVGIQTSVRLRPVWTVRVAENATTPPAPAAGHSHLALARLARRRNVAAIEAAMISDLRQTRLTLGDVERRTANLERLLLTPAFDPSPNQFSPKIGGAGQNVTLRGRNFNLVPVQVLFGAVSATVGSITPTQIVAPVPAGATGAVKITIITAGGSVVSDDTFTVLGGGPPPTFAASPNQFSPKAGGSGTDVTLFGSNLNIAPVSVLFGATAGTVMSASPTQVVARVPAGVTGAVKLTVQTGGGSIISTDDFLAGSPPAFAASPNQFSPKVGGVGQTVTLSGSNFNLAPVSVQFGNVAANVVSSTATQIVTQVPVGATGVLKIRVTTAAGSVVSDDNFTVL